MRAGAPAALAAESGPRSAVVATRGCRLIADGALAKKHDIPREQREQDNRIEYGIDQELLLGVRARKPEGLERFIYDVVDPEALREFLQAEQLRETSFRASS